MRRCQEPNRRRIEGPLVAAGLAVAAIVAVLWLASIRRDGAKAVASESHRIVGRNKDYLTFDIDCLDPSFAPGTGTPVAGGLSSAQALAILKGLAGIDFVGMDIVEVAPPYDSADITALAAAHIAHEWLALYAVRPGGPAA